MRYKFKVMSDSSGLSTEKKIIQQAKKDPEVFGRLFDKFYRPIFNYILRRTSDIDIAKDLTSQTFFKALKGLGRFRWQNVSFSAWLYRIATNEVNTFYRKKNHLVRVNIEKIPEPQSQDFADKDYADAEKEMQNKAEFARLHKNIKKLSPIYQTVISLRFFEKKKISEISRVLGRSEGTIKSRLHRAMGELRHCLEKDLGQPFRNKDVVMQEVLND